MTDNSLYDPTFEHDACGVGMVADLTGHATHATVSDALTILENLEHRGATGADADSGDGAGLLVQMPDSFVREVFGTVVPDAGDYGMAYWMIPKRTWTIGPSGDRRGRSRAWDCEHRRGATCRSTPRSSVPPRPRANRHSSSN